MPSDEVERYYDRLDGSEISAFSPFAITCPGCGVASKIDPPQWDCEHCGETLELFVGSLASKQNDETGDNCHEANGGETA